MFLTRWLRDTSRTPKARRQARPPAFHPRIESLEDRTVPSGVSFSPPVSYDLSSFTNNVAAGDFNGDGTPDLAVSEWYDFRIAVLLGNGDGTLRSAGSISTHLSRPDALATGDFNGDGKIDLDGPGLFLGNGDGTFRTPPLLGAGGPGMQVCDLNSDGKLDVVSVFGNFAEVALGNGDGTFQYRGYYAGFAVSVAVADFNGDGKLDLATTASPSGGIFQTTSLLLGNGDGSFQYPRTIPNGGGASSIVAGDFDGDGKSDLVVGASVLLGNGDGTFRTGQVIDTIPFSRVVADLNGDGTPDLIGDGGYINLGNGDGTFQARQNFFTGYGSSVAVADLNGDGRPDLARATGDYHHLDVLLNAYVTTTTLTGSGTTYYGQPAAYTATITGNGSPVTAGTVTFMDGSRALTAPLPLDANGQASFSIASLRTGSHTITAVYSGTPGGAGTTGFGPSSGAVALTVAPATLTATAVNITAPLTAGTTFTATVATFNNADPIDGASAFYALIDWGDGTTSYGTITGTDTLSVSDSHAYADAGSYTTSVTIYHNLGYTTTATVHPTATATSLGLSVRRGLAGDIGFWHGDGQALINSFNGGPDGTALSHWLAASFPNLYGYLDGWRNADVAAFYQTQFAISGAKAEAQVLATALNVYATTLSLGGTAGQAYGFTVSAAGLGAYSFNVGNDGDAFGVADGSTHTVFAFLRAVDRDPWNVFSSALRTQVNDLFDALNKAGRI